MIVPHGLTAACGGPAPSSAARKSGQDQSDKHDFGAELGALLASFAPSPNLRPACAVACGGATAPVANASSGADRPSTETSGTAVTSSGLAAVEASPAQACAQGFVGLTAGPSASMSSLLQAAASAPDNTAGLTIALNRGRIGDEAVASAPDNIAAPTAPFQVPAASVDLIASRTTARDPIPQLVDSSNSPESGPTMGKPLADGAPSTAQVPLAGPVTSLQSSPMFPASGRTQVKTQPAISARSNSERSSEISPAPLLEAAAARAEHRPDTSIESETAHSAMSAEAPPAKTSNVTRPASMPQSVHTPATTVAPLASNASNGAAAPPHPAHAVASVTSVAPPRPISDIRPVVTPARTAVLKIDLADGATAHARVSERAGSIDVHVVTNNSPVAQHVANQFGGLRRTLDGAGLRLEHAGVSYRDDGRSGRREQPQDQTPAQPRRRSGEKHFAEYEVQR